MIVDLLAHISPHSTPLEQAAKAVLRDALDNVLVHPCDQHDDNVAAKGLTEPMRSLFNALMEQTNVQ